MIHYFRAARYDASAIITTVVFFAALLSFVARAGLSAQAGKVPEFFDVGASVVLAVIIAFGWLRSVRGYQVENDEIVIVRAGPGRIRIPLANLTGVDTPATLGAFLRTSYLGIQGLFGWSGKTIVRKPTDVTSTLAEVYGTSAARPVVLHLEGNRTVVLTPADTEGFVAALKEAGIKSAPAGKKAVGKR